MGDLRQEVRPAATLEEEFVQLVNWEAERKWQDRDFLRVFIRSAIVDPAAAKVMEQVVLPLRTLIFLDMALTDVILGASTRTYGVC